MENKAKVCHLTSVHNQNDVRIFEKECQSLVNMGYDVNLMVVNCKNEGVVNGVKVINVPFEFKNRLTRIFKAPSVLYKHALKLDADVYHFHDPELLGIGKKLKKMGKKVIYDVHEDVPRQILSKGWIPKFLRNRISRIFEKYENRIAAKLDYIVAATPFIRDRFLKVNKNSIDVNNFPILAEKSEEQVRKNQICYIGALTGLRGIKELVIAADEIEAEVLLAGKFESEEFHNGLKELKGWKNIRYLGMLKSEEVRKLLLESKVGIVTLHPIINYLDALPVKMFEYMSASLPILSSNIPLWEKIVGEAQCGVCVDPKNPKEISKEINNLLKSDDLRDLFGGNGRKAVEDRFNWENEEKKLLGVYNDLF